MKKLCTFFLLALLSVSSSCNASRSPVLLAIQKEVAKGVGTLVDINTLTDFHWDRFYIFGPYAGRDFIQNTVGEKFLKDDEMRLGVPEGDCLFVFMKADQMIHQFIYPRYKGDFSDVGKKDGFGFSSENSEFEVSYGGHNLYGRSLKLRHIP